MKPENVVAITPGEGWYAQMVEVGEGNEPTKQIFDRVVGFVWLRDKGKVKRMGHSPDGIYFEDNENFKNYIHVTELSAIMTNQQERQANGPKQASGLIVPPRFIGGM